MGWFTYHSGSGTQTCGPHNVKSPQSSVLSHHAEYLRVASCADQSFNHMTQVGLTLFAVPKPFIGHTGVIQRSAITSWTLLHPRPEIVLFGREKGIAEISLELGLRHEPHVATTELGTPLLNDLFGRARASATHDIMCYVNADIILLGDLMDAARTVTGRFSRFLMVGQRCDLDCSETVAFGQGWQQQLRARAERSEAFHGECGIDYFVFPRRFTPVIPPFAIGRTAWDNWLIYEARRLGVPVVDATLCLSAIHQKHDYNHHPAGTAGVWRGPEAVQNQLLAAAMPDVFSIRDATHLLIGDCIRSTWDRWHFRRRVETEQLFSPRLRLPLAILQWILRITFPLRAVIGATLSRPGGHDRYWRNRMNPRIRVRRRSHDNEDA